jgi:hypothetical protein
LSGYAIGNEVAAETSRSAEMNAPAKTVAVSRMEVKEANIVEPLFQSVEPDHRVRAHDNARAVPDQKSRYLSVIAKTIWKDLAV